MAKITIKVGDVAVVVDDTFKLPPQAGKLTPNELLALPSVRTGAGLVCDDAAEAMRRASGFTPPKGLTGDKLRHLGARAEGYDQIISSIETMLAIFKQANRIADAEAATALSRLYDQVKTQAKDDPTLKVEFSSLYVYNATAPKTKKPTRAGGSGGGTA